MKVQVLTTAFCKGHARSPEDVFSYQRDKGEFSALRKDPWNNDSPEALRKRQTLLWVPWTLARRPQYRFSIVSPTNQNASPMTSTAASEASPSLQQVCLNAHRVCLETAAHHLAASDPDAELLRRLHDCADLTLVTAHAATRQSPYTYALARLCGEVSHACAESLDAHRSDKDSYRVAYATCLGVSEACAQFDGQGESAEEKRRDEILEESFPASDPPPPPTEL